MSSRILVQVLIDGGVLWHDGHGRRYRHGTFLNHQKIVAEIHLMIRSTVEGGKFPVCSGSDNICACSSFKRKTYLHDLSCSNRSRGMRHIRLLPPTRTFPAMCLPLSCQPDFYWCVYRAMLQEFGAARIAKEKLAIPETRSHDRLNELPPKVCALSPPLCGGGLGEWAFVIQSSGP